MATEPSQTVPVKRAASALDSDQTVPGANPYGKQLQGLVKRTVLEQELAPGNPHSAANVQLPSMQHAAACKAGNGTSPASLDIDRSSAGEGNLVDPVVDFLRFTDNFDEIFHMEGNEYLASDTEGLYDFLTWP